MGDLPPSTSEDAVRELLAGCGGAQVTYVKVGSSGDGGKYAFVSCEDKEAGEAIINSLSDTEVKGRPITV